MLLSEDNLPRGKWRLGKVEKTLVGRDGLIRTVSIRMKKGVISRPVQKEHLLEKHCDLLLTNAKASQETHSQRKMAFCHWWGRMFDLVPLGSALFNLQMTV